MHYDLKTTSINIFIQASLCFYNCGNASHVCKLLCKRILSWFLNFTSNNKVSLQFYWYWMLLIFLILSIWGKIIMFLLFWVSLLWCLVWLSKSHMFVFLLMGLLVLIFFLFSSELSVFSLLICNCFSEFWVVIHFWFYCLSVFWMSFHIFMWSIRTIQV